MSTIYYEIGTEWKSKETNADGKIRQYETFMEALTDFPKVLKEYLGNENCTKVFIDAWEQKNEDDPGEPITGDLVAAYPKEFNEIPDHLLQSEFNF